MKSRYILHQVQKAPIGAYMANTRHGCDLHDPDLGYTDGHGHRSIWSHRGGHGKLNQRQYHCHPHIRPHLNARRWSR